jgi:hypothetical protein
MGRPPWATVEQLEFLNGWTAGLDEQKKKNTLKEHYDYIAQQFLHKWPATPTDKDRETAGEGGNVQLAAVRRRTKVRYYFSLMTRY